MAPPRRVYSSGIEGLTFDKSKSVWRWRNKYTGRRKSLGQDFEKARDIARQLQTALELAHASEELRQSLPITIGQLIDMWLATEFARQPWKEQTRKNYRAQLLRYKREFGERYLASTDRVFLGEWLDGLETTADTYNGHRQMLILLWDYAIAKGLINYNEAGATLQRSMSKTIAANAKVRQRLKLDQFWAIHAIAPLYLQTAMELALITLQGRKELVEMSSHNARDGYQFVIRQKTANKTDHAFIAIPMGEDFQQIVARSRKSGFVCPYYVHRRPDRIRLENQRKKPHDLYVPATWLGKQFSKWRDKTGLFDQMSAAEKPGLHEIRALGGQLMEEAGFDQTVIQAYYGHTDRKTSQIYLDNGQVNDRDFRRVGEGLRLRDLR